MFTENDVLDALTAMLEKRTQADVAKEFGFTQAYIGDVLHGRRKVSRNLAARLGYRQMVVYAKD